MNVKNKLFLVLPPVLLILLLLAIIAWPSFIKARDKSRTLACHNQMYQIDVAKEQFGQDAKLTDGAVLTADQISPYIRGGWKALHCPSGGQYTIGKLGEDVRCSVHGTVSDIRSAAWTHK